MSSDSNVCSSWLSFRRFPILAFLVSLILLGIVSWLDYVTGRAPLFTLMYFFPIFLAEWFAGHGAGVLMCILSAVISLIIGPVGPPDYAAVFWNAGIVFGIDLTFCKLINIIKLQNSATPIFGRIHRLMAGCVILACALYGAGWLLERQAPTLQGAPTALAASPASAQANLAASAPTLEELASLVKDSMQASRPVLLGSRDPQGPSCVAVIRTGQVVSTMPSNPGDLNGGPGTTMATIYCLDRQTFTTAEQDFQWHQTRLVTYLRNEAALNGPAEEMAHDLAVKTLRFSQAADAWTTLPDRIRPVTFEDSSDWPSYCMTALDHAVAAKDLSGVRHWAGELASAAFSLDDLHRWLDFLVQNHLTALDFQGQCATLFDSPAVQNMKYDFNSSISNFPAGILSLNGLGNYYEVERQAERLFSMPSDRFAEIQTNDHLTPASLWVSPSVRECFLKLENVLSPPNQATWELAARTPYEHSYLTNMLYRAWSVDTADDLCAVLKRFDSLRPHASVGELMSVLMYRGHSFAGLEWADRFQPELIQAADLIPTSEPDDVAFLQACQWTNNLYTSPSSSYGVTLTLRDALHEKRLDCVRATDMIGAIFRNAGRTRFGNIRWCAGATAHSVAAYLGTENGKSRTLVVDGLAPPKTPEVWPDCYFNGHDWPSTLTNTAPVYAAELYLRGIDSYVWAEGYIIRGPNAGTLTTARIPYSTHRLQTITRKVFDGPYPD
jgi:hypothetical protein